MSGVWAAEGAAEGMVDAVEGMVEGMPPSGLCWGGDECVSVCPQDVFSNCILLYIISFPDPPLRLCLSGGSVWKMPGKRDWTPWMKKNRAPVLCTLGAVLLCCLQGGASVPGKFPFFFFNFYSVVYIRFSMHAAGFEKLNIWPVQQNTHR